MTAPTRQRPPGPPLMRMQWRHLLFMHWPVPVSVLRPLIPPQLEIDEFDGTAWVGLVPFTMRGVLPAFVPAWPGLGDVPRISAFHECNVRTYVTHKGEPGVWFFSLDAASRAGVWTARKFFHLPYYYAKMRLNRNGNEIRYAVRREVGVGGAKPHAAGMRCTWRAGDEWPQSRPGDLAHFLTERYALYAANHAGALFRGRIRHAPWPLRRATLLSLDDHLLRAAGIEVDQAQPPLLHHADVLDVQAWGLERV